MEIINDGYFQTLDEEILDNLVENVNLIKELRSDNEKLSQYIQNLSDKKLNSIIQKYSNLENLSVNHEQINTFILIIAKELLESRNFDPYTLYKDFKAKKYNSISPLEEKYSDLLKKINLNTSITLIPRFRDIMLPFYFDILEQNTLLTNTTNYISELNNNIDYAIESYNLRFKDNK
jgi:hypothetical protein